MTLTRVQFRPSPRRSEGSRRLPGAVTVLTVLTVASSVAGIAVGTIEARLPLGPGNTAVHHGYPFFAAGLAVVLCAVAARCAPRAPRWAGIVRLVGAAYAVNAVLIAVLALAVTPQGAALPVAGVGWLADVFFPVCDVGLLGLVVSLLPDVRPRGRDRAAVVVLLTLTGLTMLVEAFLPHTLDSTRVANPLALPVTASWSGVVQLLVPLMFLYAVLLSVVRGVVLAVASRRRGAGVGWAVGGAGLAVPVTFVGQAAVPESNPWAAGAVVLVGGSLFTLLAAHVAATLPATLVPSGICPDTEPHDPL